MPHQALLFDLEKLESVFQQEKRDSLYSMLLFWRRVPQLKNKSITSITSSSRFTLLQVAPLLLLLLLLLLLHLLLIHGGLNEVACHQDPLAHLTSLKQWGLEKEHHMLMKDWTETGKSTHIAVGPKKP